MRQIPEMRTPCPLNAAIWTKRGAFTDATYISLVRLTGWLCYRFNLTSEDVIRHYDVTGKNCPKYYVENPGKWEKFKKDVEKQIREVEKEAEKAENP